jgi:soluble lytic murein transglycosylase
VRGAGSPAAVHRRRRLVGVVVAVAAVVLAVVAIVPRIDHAVRDITLPLNDAGVIRVQAADKHLDPALIAAVIFAETKFDPRTSAAGAEGLMQILPDTARFLAHLSGGTRFTTADLATPSVNVAYGSYYLRYLLNHYRGQELPAVAAYNAGLANVDAWVADGGGRLTVADIPFPETRAYVRRVLQAQVDYRADYPHELGLS